MVAPGAAPEKGIGQLMAELRELLAQYPAAPMSEAEMAEEWLRDLSKRAQEREQHFYALGMQADRLAQRIAQAAGA